MASNQAVQTSLDSELEVTLTQMFQVSFRASDSRDLSVHLTELT